MHNGRTVIGIDIGTTSTKCAVFRREDGAMLGSASAAYPLLQERLGWAEQEPEAIVAAVVRSVREALAASGTTGADAAAAGLSTAMHALLAVDGDGRALTRSITWADNRSEEQALRLRGEGAGAEIYRRTGTPIHPMTPLTKLIWMREEQPEKFAAAARFVSIKEYIVNRLFGQWAVDYAIASATGMLSLETLDWDDAALRAAGITADKLTKPLPDTTLLRGLRPEMAEAMGLPADVPFALGGSDGGLANLGVGAVGPGELAVTVGTSGAARMIVDRALPDEGMRTFCYALGESRYLVGGATNNGGIALQWLRESALSLSGPGKGSGSGSGVISTLERMTEAAGSVPAGADGLLFLPFLSGERAPIWNSQARGSFFGLRLGHGANHMIRAVMEGVLLAVASVVKAAQETAGPAREVRLSGGFAKSPLWRQMLADMLGREVLVPQVTEASAFGAALTAMRAIGDLASWEEAKAFTPIRERLAPDPRAAAAYAELSGIYEELCGALTGCWARMSDFQNRHSQ